MRRTFIAANWKMNGTQSSVRALLSTLLSRPFSQKNTEVAFLAPSIFMPLLEITLKNSPFLYGGQDLSEFQRGAYTGEISGEMLKDAGCTYVIVGHSERRTLFHDTDDRVAEKFKAAQASGLIPILCVGETLKQREAGQTEAVIAKQLQIVLECVGIEAMAKAVIAYEPVWAIGTGQTATPAQAQAVHQFIRKQLSNLNPTIAHALQIIYGGSVKPDSAADLFAQADIDGGLIGGASLNADDFYRIMCAT